MEKTFIVRGSWSSIKNSVLDYCFTHFSDEDIWLVDTLQVFDPYYLSRLDSARTRRMLHAIKVCRPFTFYQLRDKLFSFIKLPLSERSTIIISSMDCFNDDVENEEEREVVANMMMRLLKLLQNKSGCRLIIGTSGSLKSSLRNVVR
ncbi:hypothetical protein ACFLZX_05455 [Nanoarchaeota archaeon]